MQSLFKRIDKERKTTKIVHKVFRLFANTVRTKVVNINLFKIAYAVLIVMHLPVHESWLHKKSSR